MAERIGFIGVGIMGKPMARNLLAAGYPLVVHSRSRGPVEELVAAGAAAAGNPREVAAESDVVITMLPDGPDVRAVATGPDGLLAGAREGTLWIEMSTIAPAIARELAELAAARGVGMLDAPVSGGDKGAIAATLSIMAGGSEADFERALPIFQALGKTIVHVGDIGAGQIVKACNQVVVAINFEALSEALVLGSKAGVDPDKILQVLGGGLAGSRVLELRGQSMLAHNFEPGFRLRLHRKDLNIALSTARAIDVPLPVTALVDQFITSLIAAGRGNLDHSAILTELEDLAHYTVRQGEQAEE